MQRPKILVIDDEPEIRELLVEFLDLLGYEGVMAGDGEEGLRLFKEAKFQLVLTDLGIPKLSGIEVAERIKSISPKTFVVLITGWGNEIKASSFVDYILTKPFKLDMLKTLLNKVFKRQ